MIFRDIAGSDQNEIRNRYFPAASKADLNESSQAQFCRYTKTVPQLLRDGWCKVYN